jgi:hypothetical protein
MSTAVAKAGAGVARAEESIKEGARAAAHEARRAARRGREALENALDSTRLELRRRPFGSAGLVFGLGLAIGLAVGYLAWACSRPESKSNRGEELFEHGLFEAEDETC